MRALLIGNIYNRGKRRILQYSSISREKGEKAKAVMIYRILRGAFD